MSLETRKKISESLKGVKNPNYNKEMSIEQRDKIKNTIAKFTLEKRKEINEKISNSYKKNNSIMKNKLSKKVAQYNLNSELIKIYNSISQASNDMKIDRMTISRCCDDKYINYKTAKGFIWKYHNEN